MMPVSGAGNRSTLGNDYEGTTGRCAAASRNDPSPGAAGCAPRWGSWPAERPMGWGLRAGTGRPADFDYFEYAERVYARTRAELE